MLNILRSMIRNRIVAIFSLIVGTLAATHMLAGCNGDRVKSIGDYTSVGWNELPAVDDADLLAGFAAWRAGCGKLRDDAVWKQTCTAASQVVLSPIEVRTFLQSNMDVFALGKFDACDGLITGYYEPVYPGSLAQADQATVPIYGVPSDLLTIKLDEVYPELKGKRLRGRVEGRTVVPYFEAETIAKNGVIAPILAWLFDPMDLHFLQIQGSGRVQLPGGQQLRIGYADQNGHRYRAIGKWLVDQGELKLANVSMQSIRAWAKAHPERVTELLASNPSYVFFKRERDGNEGPVGSFGLPLTAGYSAAVDRRSIPLGSLVWLSTATPDGAPLVRPIAAHDTGGAIVGATRADLFIGTGEAAGELAGRMKQKGRLWLLWPKGKALPVS